jgi:ABC-type Na+ efflux pump permease subunit
MTLMLAMSLIGLLAMVSAASLSRERENGVLELLLTTPLRPPQIVQGRLRGIWTQFLPSLVFFLAVLWFVESMFSSYRQYRGFVWGLGLLITYYLTVPVGGLWFSLRSRAYVPALLLTLGYMGVLPWLGTILVWTTSLSLGEPVALALVFLFGFWGVAQMRFSLGPLIAVLTGVWLLLACVELIFVPEARGQYDHRRVPSIILILPNLLLGAAGFAHHRLLRELGPGYAERRRRRD